MTTTFDPPGPRKFPSVESQFRLVVESSPSAVVLIQRTGEVVLLNTLAENMFGYGREELLGQPVETLVPLRFRAGHPQLRNEFFADPQTRGMGVGSDLYGRRKDGSEFPVEIGLNPIPTEAGLLILTTIVDITERKQAQDALRQAHDQLEQRVRDRTAELEAANQELEAFSYSVSHDLRAPLRAIDGFSRILLDDYSADLPADARNYLQIVRESSQGMGQLLDDLLRFARLSRQPLAKRPVPVGQIVKLCLDELQVEHADRHIETSMGELPDCDADPTLLKQVWFNLLANAFKYTRKRNIARIEIGSLAGERSDWQTYFVRDNGAGFDMRYINKLFGVFQRLHRTEEFEGNGVGLAIVQRIIHRHGGRVWAEARPNEGATFFFTLPQDTPQGADAHDSQRS
ncbi:MAG: PAS domain S-box protein [Planctomycetes bacterium]|nr:PAS domain S-box protein [Planctomycetota bacterium]